jgi:hypothetical protein
MLKQYHSNHFVITNLSGLSCLPIIFDLFSVMERFLLTTKGEITIIQSSTNRYATSLRDYVDSYATSLRAQTAREQ